jgi:hypothetical protein
MRTNIGVLGILAVCASTVADASTTTYHSPIECKVESNSYNWEVIPSGTNTGSFASTETSVVNPFFCSAMNITNGSVVVQSAWIYYTDNNASSTAPTGLLDCRFVLINWDGSVHSSSWLYGCGTYGGCTCATCSGSCVCASWTGGGQLNYTSPFGTTAFNPKSMYFECDIPPVYSSAMSSIDAYQVVQQ